MVTDQQRMEADGVNRAGGLICPCCEGAYLITRHCKRLCEQCGYVESCEDSFIPNQPAPREKIVP